MSNICVAGHRGFIGSNLINHYLIKKSSDNFYYINSNLLDTKTLEIEISKLPNIDTLIFLVGGNGNNFTSLFEVNTSTLYNLINLLLSKNLKNIIFSSTGGVYGEPQDYKSKETDILKPNSYYGLSKIYSEELLRYFFNNFNLNNVFILRFSNIYGPGNRKGVIYNFLKSIKNNSSILFEGTGKEKREFLYIEDAVLVIIKTLGNLSLINEGKKNFEILNVSDDEVYTLEELTQIIRSLGLDFKINYSNTPNLNTIKTLSLDSTKIKKLYNWKPLKSLKEGIQEILNSDYKNF